MTAGGKATGAATTAYAFDNAWQEARRRLSLVEEYADSTTRRRIEALGIREGWRCFEPGFGGGSIARWLSQRVGPSGHVLAVDLDIRFLAEEKTPNLEVRQQDIVAVPPPENAFDLVHVRLLLMHLPQREQVLERLVASLKPGGWLLVEEQESFPFVETHSPAGRRVWEVVLGAMRAGGIDAAWARTIPERVRRLGLVDIGTDVNVTLTPGGSPTTELWRLSTEQIRPRLVAAGLLTHEQMDEIDAPMRDPTQWFYGPAMVAVWGRRPSASS
jgi:SAM-dependent methyltransferase